MPARRLEDVQRDRRTFRQGDRTVIQEPGRVIIEEGGRTIIRHDETERFRSPGRAYRSERRGRDLVNVYDGPDGTQIITTIGPEGNLLRRSRRYRDGREVVIIDNAFDRPVGSVGGYYVDVPPPVVRMPRERYIVDAGSAPQEMIDEVLVAPPVARIDRRYTLDQIRYSPNLRAQMPSVDVNSISFDSGSWAVRPDQVQQLAGIAEGIRRALAANANEVFLIEGHTDAVGPPVDNLSLSDRRATSVAEILSQNFQIPPENLTTQGYGEQNLKVATQGPSEANRRVTVRRITPLLSGQNQQQQ
ncbi:hypothetical protein GCM10010994_05790 [Chelatococcus reniformis]|uniref:OmpA-like domain-containing protein n=1 Tax=Chelatococcus reniformis TaxID=1494448 RepID=A0A916TX25_9HYPH|nr:hypothetical protein GCM10010994_05790 [Chelatococcus reniformis]